MKISVIGCGRWGSCIAWYLDSLNRHDVTIYGREKSASFLEIKEKHGNSMLTFSDSMQYTSDIIQALSAETIIISIGSQGLRDLMKQIADTGVCNKNFILCMKGIEIDTGKRLTEIVEDELTPKNTNCKVAVWLGPGHVQEITRYAPGCMVIDSKDDALKKELVREFTSDRMRFYYGDDLIGNELGAALKNVIGIAAGMLDGMDFSALKGALTTRGTHEVAKLIGAMGGNPLSAYGLCHLGDYAATVFSEYSNNRMFGELFVKGEKFDKLAEGYYTVKATMALCKKYNVQMPITEGIYSVLYENTDPRSVIRDLMARNIKSENK